MFWLPLYRMTTEVGGPLIRRLVAKRLARGREDPERVEERFGIASRARPTGRLVWIHAASVGESVSVLPLIDALRKAYPQAAILMTTGTVTSARLMAERLPEGVIHQFVPLDRLSWVRRFLDHWKPDAALWVESELWPNLVSEATDRGISLALVNARMSQDSFRNWRRLPGGLKSLLSAFQICLAQDAEQAGRLSRLGAPQVLSVGNLKYAAPPLPCDQGELARLWEAFGRRPLWLAASTHPGEEEQIADAHLLLRESYPGLLTILVPRHAERGSAISALLGAKGLYVAQRSAGEMPDPESDVYLADTMGELGLFYRLSEIAFMGGSLIPHGGQNPLEPARLEVAILYGPHMTNFAEIVRALEAADAGQQVSEAESLASAVEHLLSDETERRRRASAAHQVAEAQAGVLDRVLGALTPLLDAALDPRTKAGAA
ncbi:3-deoxy-D-manno-octulosonic acid transferase [Limibacillus halophilus]